MALNASPRGTSAKAPCSARRARTRARNASSCAVRSGPSSAVTSIVERNWLRCDSQGGELAGRWAASTSSTWSASSASNSSSADGPVVGEALLGEEVRVAGGDHAVDGEEPGVAVVGVEPVALPRVVAEHDVGPQPPDPVGHLATAWRRSGLELAVDPAEEHHLAGGAEGLGRGPLLDLAGGDQRGEVGVGVPRALRPVGAHEVVRPRSRRPPTWPGWRRTRTRCRRGGRRWPAPGAGAGRSRDAHGGIGRPRARRRAATAAQVEVGGQVDVPAERRVARRPAAARPEPAGLGPVAGERPGAVGEPEAGAGRDAGHVGAVVGGGRARG